MTTDNLRKDIELRHGAKSARALTVVKDNPGFASMLSKLNLPREQRPHDDKGNTVIDAPERGNFNAISQDIAQRATDAESIMQLFPEMELSAQILISSVLAPKDMSTTEINYTFPEGLEISPISAQILSDIQEYFEQTYKIETLLPDILREILFGSGAYPVAVIPENSVDELINGITNISMESLMDFSDANCVFKPLGILGDPYQTTVPKSNISIESFAGEGLAPFTTYKPAPKVDVQFKSTLYGKDEKTTVAEKILAMEHLFVTDNPNALKMPKIVQRKRQQDMSMLLARSMPGMALSVEGFSNSVSGKDGSKLNDIEITSLFYKNRTKGYSQVVKVKTDEELKRTTIGPPLIINLPAESCIPVFTPGNEKRHVAYFVLLDAEGNPLSKHSGSSQYSDLRSKLQAGGEMSSHLLNSASKINGTNCKDVTFDQAAKVYSEIVDANLKARLRTGIMGSNMELGSLEEISRVMLARQLMKQNTQILFIPIDLVTYYAYRYTDAGTGKSLLDDMRILNSLRAMLLFSQVMASVRNSIGRTRVKLKLSENDPNPQKTIETGIHEVMKTRQASFPLTMTTPSGLADWVQKAGTMFEFEGHPGIPDTAVEFSETSTNYQKPDTELDENLRKRSIMATGLSPETVDSGFSTEFATTAINNNLLLAKRVKQIQEAFIPQVTDNCRKVAINDGNLVNRIKTTIKENLDKIVKVDEPSQLVQDYGGNEPLLIHLLMINALSNFEVTLSSPDNVTLKNQMEAFTQQVEAYEKAIDFYVNDSLLPSAMGGEQASQRVAEIKQMILGYYMRRWMSEKHILPELAELVSTDDEGNPIINIKEAVQEHTNALTRSVVKALEKTVPTGQAADRDVERITGGEDLGESTATSGGGGGGFDSGGDSGSSDPFGGGDMSFPGMGDDGLGDASGDDPEAGMPADPDPLVDGGGDASPPTA